MNEHVADDAVISAVVNIAELDLCNRCNVLHQCNEVSGCFSV